MAELNVCKHCGSHAVDEPPVTVPLFGGTKILGFVGCSSKHHGRRGKTEKCNFYLIGTEEGYNKAVENWNKDNPHKSWADWWMRMGR